jgi:isopenicillin N synthase-like dioxygenase
MASASIELPVIELAQWLGRKGDSDAAVQEMAKKVADCFQRTGVVIVRDPRVSEDDNNRFVDLMERYYDQPDEVKVKDARPELHYQVSALFVFFLVCHKLLNPSRSGWCHPGRCGSASVPV